MRDVINREKIIFIIIFFLINISTYFANQADSLSRYSLILLPKQRLEFLLNKTWQLRSSAPRDAIVLGKRSIDLAKSLRDYRQLAKAYNFLGVIYRNIGQYDSSFVFYNNALKYAQMAKDSTQIAYAYNNIGGYYGYKHKYFLAIEYVFMARNFFELHKNFRGTAYCDVQLGLWFRLLQEYDRALEYLNEALEIRKKLKDNHGLIVVKSLIGDVYYDMGEFDKILPMELELLEIYETYNDKKGIGITLGNLGGIYFAKGEYKKALEYRTKAIKYLKEIDFKIGIVNNLNGLGEIYLAINQPNKAVEILKKSLKIAKSIGFNVAILKTYSLLIQANYKLKNFDSVYFYHQREIALKDSIDKLERKSVIEEFEKLSEFKRISNKNISLQNKLKQNKIIFIGIVIIFILILFILVIIYRKNKILKESQKKLREAIKTKDKLFSIVAHDLRSPFTALLGYTGLMLDELDEMSKDELREFLSSINRTLHNLLAMIERLLTWARAQDNKISYNPESFNLKEEVNKIIAPLEENFKLKNINLEINVNDISIYSDKELLRTILSNLLSNSIKFTPHNGSISISSKITDDRKKLKITVKDTGVGIPKEKIEQMLAGVTESTSGTGGEKGTGLGMSLVIDLVKKSGGEIEIKSEVGKGTEISFTLPIAKENE